MASIPLRHEDDPTTDPAIMAAMETLATGDVPVLNVLRAFANKPETLYAFMGLANAVYNFGDGQGTSDLSPQETELAYTAATVANNCFY